MDVLLVITSTHVQTYRNVYTHEYTHTHTQVHIDTYAYTHARVHTYINIYLYNLFQMKPTRCTLLLSIFISNYLHVSGNYVPIIRRTYCIYATLVLFTLYGWLSGLQTNTEWKIPVSHRYSKFSWWWAHSCPKHVQKLK